MKEKNILPPTYLLIAMLLMLILHLAVPVVRFIPSPWHILGLVPLAFGIIINLAADSTYRRAGTTVKPFQESTALITDGVYRFSRHPMFLGFTAVLMGVAFLLRSLSSWLIVPIFAMLMEIIFIRVEERMLEQKFCQDWLDYKRKVRRWI